MSIKFHHKFGKYLIILLLFGFILFLIGNTKAELPNEYVANYEIKSDYDKILGFFVQIDASSKIGQQIPTNIFSELSTSFQNIFPKFPQDYSFKVVYEQCLLLTNNLVNSSTEYQNNLGSFMSNCYKPFSDIIKTINSQYTITAKAKVSPQEGPAPITVTFDARESIDPSNETIPSKNFYWYYRDVDGQDKTIGNDSVVNTTFTKPGNYLVLLTVRSSNKQSKGIFDGEQTLSVNVTPTSAIISVYANGQKFKADTKIKIGTQEAQKGVVLDGSATMPIGGRKILSHIREINSKDGFSFFRTNDGAPSVIKISLPDQGEYTIKLTTVDNESNKLTEKFDLLVSDPVAIIKQSPELGNTSTTFNFDSSPSYAVLSNIKLYTREIFDQNGNKLDTFQGKSIKQNFKKPGSYTIKLSVEDELGQTNTDSVQIVVDSTDPVPQFTIEPTNERKNPSEFILNASSSQDIDKLNGNDSLSYEWKFSDGSNAKIIDTKNNNEQITVDFDSVGKHKIILIAKDSYGKIAEIQKEIDVKSTLRPQMFIAPITTIRGNPINFVVKSNQTIFTYNRDFSDGDKRTIQADKISHIFKKTGIYKVTLTVNGTNGMDNEVSKNVFVGEKDSPIAAYIVSNNSSQINTQNEICSEIIDGKNITYPAYQVKRQDEIKIDPSLSVNTKGENSDLSFYFQPHNGEIFKQDNFTYKFKDLGCEFIDMTVEDISLAKNDKTKIWFKVVNALPKLDNLMLSFPQYGNEMGIGFKENSVKDIFNDKLDPLIVKVSAQNPVDSDGFISYYKRYYYLKDDPANPIELKITPYNIPYTFFSLPRVPGEFMFGVTMYDNDDGKLSSEELIGNGPIVFFPPDVTRPDIPLVTIKTDQSSVEVGDEVTFDVISKIISDRADFIKDRTIYYDFDGDGEWDLVTKNDRTKYIYKKPSPDTGFKPRAAVIYRGYKGVSNGGNIIVKKGLKPMLLSDSFDKFAIFRDISIGDVFQKEVCLDQKECNQNSGNILTTGNVFSFTYPDYGKYIISLSINDKYANSSNKKWSLNLNSGNINSGDFHILSIPKANVESDNIQFFVGKNLDNSILYYIFYDNSRGTCYVDNDITIDSDGDGNKDNDKDFLCNELYFKKYEPKYESMTGRIYFTQLDSKIISKDFSISFLDFDVELDSETLIIYKDVQLLIDSIKETNITGSTESTFKILLVNLRDGLIDKINTKSNLVSIKDFLQKNEIKLSNEQNTILQSIFTKLTDKSVAAAGGGTEYEKSKAEILSILPDNLAVEIQSLFQEFESAELDSNSKISQQDQRKAILQKIVDNITKNVATDGTDIGENQVDPVYMKSIMLSICNIMKIYTIQSNACVSEDTKVVPENIPTESGVKKINRLKIILIILGSLVGLFVILVIIFAVKAKINQESEIEPETTTPKT
ncbi:MAG: PKD domain-containing protein [Candidatus Absconditabacterales bacterium]